MNKLVRQLLSSGSLAALQLCAFGGTAARAAGTTISGAHTNVNVTTPKDFIHVTNTATLTGSLTNSTTIGNGTNADGIQIDNGASITGSLVNAAAGVINATNEGIIVQGSAILSNITNSGKIQVSNTIGGSARAVSFEHVGATAANLTSTGTILVSAVHTYTSNGTRYESAYGMNEEAFITAQPTLTINNSGPMSVKATNVMHATSGTVRAHAFAGFALRQSGYAIGTLVPGNVATYSITNSGAIAMAAHASAFATSSGRASATARVEHVLYQNGGGTPDIEASITNSGALTLAATAKANTTSDNAFAEAKVGAGSSGGVIYQDMFVQPTSNAGVARHANLSVTNSGVVSLAATATAVATDSQAQAEAYADFIVQRAFNAGKTTQTITNTSTGSLTLSAVANAAAAFNSATASANVANVFFQSAGEVNPATADNNISQIITNNATMTLTAAAKAVLSRGESFESAQASAKIFNVFRQSANSAIVAAQAITNTGALTLTAKATATAHASSAFQNRDSAIAHAKITRVFWQSARDISNSASHTKNTVTQAITNSGALTLKATAAAQGQAISSSYSVGTRATASIRDVFSQDASHAASVAQAITNTGALSLTTTAKAKMAAAATPTFPFYRLSADAGIGDVFFQEASDVKSITETIVNNAALSAAAAATATALTRKAHAGAFADINDVFSQYAYNANDDVDRGSITQAITNTGALTLTATAKASGMVGFGTAARAEAEISDVFIQDAYDDINTGHPGNVSQTIVNSGALTLNAQATATGHGTRAKAHATGQISSIAYQYATGRRTSSGISTITQSITNSGSLKLTLGAKATGQAVTCCSDGARARVEASSLLQQYAYNSAATQTITNTGSVTISETAAASGDGTGSFDEADAILSEFARQYAQDGSTVSQTFSDTAAIVATLTATAKTAHQPTASASIRNLVKQSASSNSGTVAQNIAITSTGSITLTYTGQAVAPATSTRNANAWAENSDDPLFYQYARCAGGAISQIFSNAGVIKLIPTATATGGAHAQAHAKLFEPVVRQYNSESFEPLTQTITNSGTLSIAETAKAKGKIATAEASFESRIFEQTGNETGKPVAQTITNSGTIALSAKAAATATVGRAAATALVNDTIYYQRASADNRGAVTQAITNSGSLAIALTAVAKGKTNAFASAWMDTPLADQTAEEGYTSINQTFTNSGTISLTQSAKALAPTAIHAVNAEVGISRIVDQFAESGFITTAASAHVAQAITNSGNLTIKAQATATGGSAVSASAGNNSDHELFFQSNDGDGSGVTQSVTNSGTISVTMGAKAVTPAAKRAQAYAESGEVVRQEDSQSNEAGQSAALTIANSGTISLALAATATGLKTVTARATGAKLFIQTARENNTASLSFTNSGTVTVNEQAIAGKGTRANADAFASFVEQRASRESLATFTFANSKTMTLKAAATAAGATDSAKASARAFGVRQSLEEASSSQTTHSGTFNVNNSGTLSLTATAKAGAGNYVRASASAIGFSLEDRQNNATVNFTNSGTINVSATATVVTGTAHIALHNTAPANVSATAIGVMARAFGSSYVQSHNSIVSTTVKNPASQTLAISNSGTFTVAAVAIGAGVDHAKAVASAVGIAAAVSSQVARHSQDISTNSGLTHHSLSTNFRQYTGTTLRGTISNSGTFSVSATATGGKSTATGIKLEGGTDAAAVTNATGGTLSVTAAGATALAKGIDVHNVVYTSSNSRASTEIFSNVGHTSELSRQFAQGSHNTSYHGPAIVTGNITNSGTLTVSATGTVSEQADGIAVNASSVSSTILSSGTINVTAAGPAAVANAIHLYASKTGNVFTRTFAGHTSTASSGTVIDKNTHSTTPFKTKLGNVTLSGTVSNSGTINVAANATLATAASANGINVEGGTLTGASILNGGTINATATSVTGAATANGILIAGTGKFSVSSSKAITATATTKGAAIANGINVQDAPVLVGPITITTSGAITANASGATAVGNAVLATGSEVFNITNAGGTLSSLVTVGSAAAVYGNAINVTAAAAATIALQGGTLNGNIVENAAGNTITVSAANTLLNGQINPSKAKIGTLTIASGGTLTLGINSGLGAGSAWVNTFTQTGTLGLNATSDPTVSGSIHAAKATLSGPLALNLDVTGAAIPLTNTYKVVFSDATLSGTWSAVSINDPTFFSAVGVYTANEADVTVTRAQLGAISGLTSNESAVGNVLEKIYEAGGGTGPLAPLTTALFALTPTQYADALQQLSGETIGDLANADSATLQNFTDAIVNHLGDTGGTGTETASLSGVSGVHPAQMSEGPVNVWGGFVATGGGASATASSPAYHTHETGLLAGADFQVVPAVTLGAALGYTNGSLKTNNDHASYNAIQIFGYGHYDVDRFYLQGDVGYGSFSNHLQRTISIPGLATGTVSGHYDTSTVQVYGEAGYHLDTPDLPINLTPYVAISYLNADADPYTETGSFVAPLAVASSSSDSVLSYLGAQFSQTWGVNTSTVTGRVKAAWEHNFTTQAWTMNAAFAPVSAFSFGISDSGLARDAAFVDAGFTLHDGDNLDLMLDYNGRLASNFTQNAIVGRLIIKW